MEFTDLPFHFFNVCFMCNGPASPKQTLKRCGGCQLVVYCSKNCQKDDRPTHKYVCKEFPVVNGKNVLHTTGPWRKHITELCKRAARLPDADVTADPIFRNPRVCNNCQNAQHNCLTDCKCACVTYCSKLCADADTLHKEDCSNLSQKAQANILNNMHMSYPMSLFYALQSLYGNRFGRNHILVEDRTTLTIHIVTSSNLFNTIPWELCFMHNYPKLMKLKLVFIMQENVYKPETDLNALLVLQKCKDCEAKNRDIKYLIHRMQYHTFFSKVEYTEPDFVVVYGNIQELLISEDGDKHSEISYRNMTNSEHTMLILMEATEDLVKQGAIAVNDARPVEELVPPTRNLYRGSGSKRAGLDKVAVNINEKSYFTCLRRK